MIGELKRSEGSVQGIERIPAEVREVYRTAWEIPQKALIEMAADRGAFIDQSQSLNLFMESPSIGKLSSMYMYAWKQGVKTTYYLRSRPATRINQTTSGGATPGPAEPTPPKPSKSFTDEEALACSLETRALRGLRVSDARLRHGPGSAGSHLLGLTRRFSAPDQSTDTVDARRHPHRPPAAVRRRHP